DNPTIDDLVDVFEDRVDGWTLSPAAALMNMPHGAIAGFSLSLMYFEGIWSYICGESSNNRSKKFFVSGFLDVFSYSPVPEQLLRRVALLFYTDARCGFFHDGMFRDRILFGRTPGSVFRITLPKRDGAPDLKADIETIIVDPAEFLSKVRLHF